MRAAEDFYRPSVAVVVVTYNSGNDVAPLIEAVSEQLQPADQFVILDNASSDETVSIVRSLAPAAEILVEASNCGFAGGVNRAVEQAKADLILLLNPDAVPQPGCLDALRRTAVEEPTWGAWQALVTLPGGTHVNTSGGRMHFLGFGWSGAWGERLPDEVRRGPVGFASGAALCVRRSILNDLGVFDPHFFMYCEDLELSIRIRSAGWQVGVEPAAIVAHDYEFDKGGAKWYYLERNRWATIIANYPARLLALLLPALVIFDLALLLVAARQGWLLPKLRSMRSVVLDLPHNARRRRIVQAQRSISASDFAAALTAQLDGQFFGPLATSRALSRAQRCYWRVIRALL